MNLTDANAISRIASFYQSELFVRVQMSGIFPDSKTFADAIPKQSLESILEDYKEQKNTAGFSLKAFVMAHFELPKPADAVEREAQDTVAGYLQQMWQLLQRKPDPESPCSLLPLPYPYIVPGGRFQEIYYWDSYFTALGLAQSGNLKLIEAMVKNFVHLQRTIGLIPNGNRDYYHSRSQPPVLALMVELLWQKHYQTKGAPGRDWLAQLLPFIEAEYQFWMADSPSLNGNKAYKRLLRMPNGQCLNRYWDDSDSPRPESYLEDVEAAATLPESKRAEFYRNIRAACESGWDFSSRWLRQPDDLHSIQTTNIVPVDLNALLYKVEALLAKFHAVLGNPVKSSQYEQAAKRRQQAIDIYCWNEEKGAYFDYDLAVGKQSEVLSAATCAPLFVGLASQAQANAVANTVSKQLLRKGGIMITNQETVQQWDAPNGWAPLQWFAVAGFKRYGLEGLAQQIMQSWISAIESHYQQHQCLMEKYNVVDPVKPASGGEYTVQEGFGWTNGVTQAFYGLLGST